MLQVTETVTSSDFAVMIAAAGTGGNGGNGGGRHFSPATIKDYITATPQADVTSSFQVQFYRC